MDPQKSEQFYWAASNGNLPILEALAPDPTVNLNWQYPGDLFTPLHASCQSGEAEIVRFLLGLKGLDRNAPQQQGLTPLCVACASGHVDVVALLLSDGRVDVNKPSDTGETPLFLACLNGHMEVASLLLGDGRVDVNIPEAEGSTPLWIASQKGHLAIAQQILASGRHVETRKVSTYNNTAAAKNARLRGERPQSEDGEAEEDFQRVKENCPKIAKLIEAYDLAPDATISQIRAEIGSCRRLFDFHIGI